MGKKLHNFICRRLVCLALAMAAVLPLVPPLPAQAYLQGDYTLKGKSHIGINLMFDSLTAEALQIYQSQLGSLTAEEKKWGHKGNPYVIDNDRHLQNLYILQNSGQITSGSHFLVCTPEGKPVAVGSQSSSAEPIQPVGTGSHPFTGTMGGAFQSGTATLSTGETITGSAIDGVQVDGSGKIDVGFFGMVGPGAKVENLIFANVTIQGSGTAPADPSHTYYKDVKTDKPQSQRKDPQETNHIGIIAGHVERATMKKLSVYYSNPQKVALDLAGGTDANYLCGTGFFGLLDHLNPNDPGGGFNNDDFVSGGGSEGGGDDYGNNPGYIRAEQLFELRDAGIDESSSVQLRTLKENGKPKVKPSEDVNKGYIYDGVFAIALSQKQDDVIESIWSGGVRKNTPSLFSVLGSIGMLADGTEGQQYGDAPEAVPPEETVPDTTAPEQPDIQEKQVEVVFRKEPADTRLSVFSLNDRGERIPHLSIGETEKKMAEAGMDPATLDLSAVQSIKTWDKNNVYLLAPGSYYVTARREGYEPMEAQSFTVDERSDTMRIQIRLLPLVEESTEPSTDPPEPPTDGATEPAEVPQETEIPGESTVPAETETVPAETDPIPADPVPAETQAPIEAPAVYRVPSRASALPDLYFGATLAESSEPVPPAETDGLQTEAGTDGGTTEAEQEQTVPEESESAVPQEPEEQLSPGEEMPLEEESIPQEEAVSPMLTAPRNGKTVSFVCRPGTVELTLDVTCWGNKASAVLLEKIEEPGQCTYVYESRPGYLFKYTGKLPGYQDITGQVQTGGSLVELVDQKANLFFKGTEVLFSTEVPDITLTVWMQQNGGYTEYCKAAPGKPVELPLGEYSWTAAAPGYQPVRNPGPDTAFTVTKDPLTVQVALEAQIMAGFEFLCTPADALLVITNAYAEEIYRGTPGMLQLPAGGPYTWKLSKLGFEMQSGEITVENIPDQKLEIVLTEQPCALVRFVVQPAGATVQILDGNGEKMPPEPDGSYLLPEGAYTYRVSQKRYVTQEAQLIITAAQAEAGEQVTQQVQLVKEEIQDSGLTIPADGALPPLEQVGGGGVDQIRLAKNWKWSQVPASSEDTKYCIYLEKVTSLSQLHTSDAAISNARYFICPTGNTGANGTAPAYLNLQYSGDAPYILQPFPAAKPADGTEIYVPKQGWVPPGQNSYKKTPDLVMAFDTPENRMIALADLGLQIRPTETAGQYEIFQSVLDWSTFEWTPRFYLGYCPPPSDPSARTILKARSNATDLFANMHEDAFHITLSGGGNSWKLQSSTNINYKPGIGYGQSRFTSGGNTEFAIYQVREYGITSGSMKDQWVPDGPADYTLPADQYVLWREPTYRDPTQDQISDMGPYSGTYQLLSLDELGQKKGWKVSSGAPMSSGNYVPSKCIRMTDTLLREGSWSGSGNDTNTIKIPLKKNDQSKTVLLLGSLGFHINEKKPGAYIRMIVVTPTVKNNGKWPTRLGIWQVADKYWHYKAESSIQLPISSQPASAETAAKIQVEYRGETYPLYLQGEKLLIATEFTLADMQSSTFPGGFFALQTVSPMQLVYCAAEGIADGSDQPGPNPTKGNLDTIDFVYTLNDQVIPVTDSRYVKSNQILQFDNFAKGSGSPYVKIYTGSALLFRQAMQASPGPGDPRITHTLSPYMKMQEIGSPSDSLDPPKK